MIILDSNIWIWYLLEDDSLFEKSKEIIKSIYNKKIFISDYLISEIITVLLIRWNKGIVDDFLEIIYNNEDVKVIYTSPIIFHEIIKFFKENNFNKLSFVDQSLLFLSKDFEIITFDKELNKALWN